MDWFSKTNNNIKILRNKQEGFGILVHTNSTFDGLVYGILEPEEARKIKHYLLSAIDQCLNEWSKSKKGVVWLYINCHNEGCRA